jgi:DMSO/TMAO reductase YedYZ molybdopterin-dependent catalytic subunit
MIGHRDLVLILAAVAVVISVLLAAVFLFTPVFRPGAGTPAPLTPVEVRSYQGQDLSSVNDLRENAIRGTQYINDSTYHLTVTGLVNRSTEYSYDDVLGKFPHYTKIVTLHCVEGWDATILWEGVLVRDIISDAGANPRANTVVFTAVDGYTTSFPLSYFTDRDIILAYRMNNVTLSPERGYPFQLVAEDKWGYKWIKWIEKIELTDDPSYRGYWEERGYSNSGDLNRSFTRD